jgi:hypothetical protein
VPQSLGRLLWHSFIEALKMPFPIITKVKFIIQEQFRRLELLRMMIEQAANRAQLLTAASERAEINLAQVSVQLDQLSSQIALLLGNSTLAMEALSRILEGSDTLSVLGRLEELRTKEIAAANTVQRLAMQSADVEIAIRRSREELQRLANLVDSLSQRVREAAGRIDRLQTHPPVDPATTGEKLYFLHIPKTAGTTLRNWLLNTLDVEDYLECHHLWQLNGVSAEKLAAARFYSGHFGLALWDRLPTRPTTITFLREPVSHQLSTFRYLRLASDEEIRKWGTTWSRPLLIELARQNDPKIILESEGYRSSFANIQVRFLGGGRADGAPSLVDVTMFDRACETLNAIDSFGLVERMEESFLLIEDRLGWPPRKTTERLNVTTSSKEDATDVVFRDNAVAFAEANAWDMKLYQFARKLFQERLLKLENKLEIAQHKDLDGPDIGLIRDVLSKQMLAQPPRVPRFKFGRRSPSATFFGEGWDERVEWPPIGRWLRWANRSGMSSILLPLEPHARPLLFRFETFFLANQTVRDALAITIGGKPTPAQRADVMMSDGIFHNVYEAVLPPHIFGNAPYWAVIALTIPRFALTTLTPIDASSPQRPFALGNIELLEL